MNEFDVDLNEFFVECFNDILREEERAIATISSGKISVKEVHLIEAIYKAEVAGDTTLGNISKILGVSQGTLSVAVTALENKGFVRRVQRKSDRRSYSLVCTEQGEKINALHVKFHENMIADVVKHLNVTQTEILTKSLKRLHQFFKSREKIE